MIRTHFERLRVYQLAEQLGDQLWEIVEKWKPMAQRVVGEQLVRAADSIGANIAEGSGKGSMLDNRRFVRWLADRSTKRNTGSGVPFAGGCCPLLKSNRSKRRSMNLREHLTGTCGR